MFRLLWRSLFVDRSRSLLSVLAVAGAIVLVIVLEGFKVGLYRQVSAYPSHLPVQLVATQLGVQNMVAARSVLPTNLLGNVQTMSGVTAAYPLVGTPAMFQRDDRKTPIYIIGYDPIGGPWRLKKGRNVAQPGEMVVDYSLARKYGLAVGDRTELFGESFSIVGLSAETTSMFSPYVFLGLADARALFPVQAPSEAASNDKSASFLLIKTEPGARVSEVRRAMVDLFPNINLFTPAELAANDVAMMRGLLGSVMNLLVGVAYVVGILVIALTLYAAIFERLREYGIMKAMGARNGRLYRYVLGQALTITAVSLAAGLLAGLGVAALIGWAAPQYLVVPWDGQVVLRTAVAALLMASLASLLPIRQVAGVDPALVFRQ